MAATELASDILSAATALAGLLLVFIGSVVTAYDGYDTQSKESVRREFLLRAMWAFGGFFSSLTAAFLALTGKWVKIGWLESAAAALLVLSFLIVLFAAYVSVRDIWKT